MTQWQLHRENMASQAGLGYRVQNGPAVLYSSATHADGEPDGGRSFCLSRERDTMQQLNQRLAWYLQQVQFLEAANEKLEIQIQEVLDEKFPKDLTELDGNLTTSSMLQEQIGSYLTDQAQLKLHLLNTELTVCDFRLRCEKEIERRECVEAEINKLRMKEEELHGHRLPELHGLLNDRTQELMQLQMQHQQNVQVFRCQDSGAPAVQMLTAEPSHLIQQLDNLRLTSVALIDQNTNEHWFNNPVTMDHPAESEVAQAELEHLRRTTFSLEQELTQLQDQNMMLEAAGLDQNESFVVELAVLEQRADGLCTDLESLLQASEHQVAEHQNLLDIKSRLQTQIQDYIRLLDGQGVSSLHSSSWTNVTSFCGTSSPSAFRRNLRAMDVQRIPRSQICSFGHTLVDLPLSKPVSTLQSNWVRSQTHYSPRSSINSVNLNGSFANRFGSLPEKTERESMRISRVIKRPCSPTVDKVHDEDRALQNSLIVDTNICLDKETSKPEMKTAHRFSMLVPKSHPVRIAAIQAKPDTFNSTETTTYAEKTETEITTTILCAEAEVKQGSHFETHTTTTYPSKETASEAKKETETLITQMNSSEGSIQTENRDLTQVVSETVEYVEEVSVTTSVVSESETQANVSCEITSPYLRLNQSTALSDASNSQLNKVMDGADTGSCTATSSSSSPGSNDNFESKTIEKISTLVLDTQSKNLKTNITKTIPCAEPEVKQGSHFETHTTTTYPIKRAASEAKKETKTVISAQINSSEGSIQTENRDLTQVVSETVVEEVVVTGSVVSESQILKSEETKGKIPDDLTKMHDKDTEQQEIKVEDKVVVVQKVTSPYLRLYQSSALSDASNSQLNKVMDGADTGSCTAMSSSSSPGSNDNFESKTIEKISTLVLDTQSKNLKTNITTAIPCAEPEVKQGSHTTTSDPSKGAASEVKKDIEISAQMNSSEGSIQTENRDNARVVSLSLDKSEESVKYVEEVVVTGSVVSESQILKSEETKGKIPDDLTKMDDMDTEQQEIKVEDKVVVVQKVTSPYLRLNQSTALSDASNSQLNKVMDGADTGSCTATSSSSSPGSNDFESKTIEKISTLVLDTQSKNLKTNITKTIPCAEPEVKQGSHFETHTTTTYPIKQTASEANKETKTVISAQINSSEGSIQTENRDLTQVVSETVVDKVVVTGSVVTETQILKSEETKGKIPDDLTKMDDKDTEQQEIKVEDKVVVVQKVTSPYLRLYHSSALSDASNSQLNKVMDGADTGSCTAMSSCSGPDSSKNLESKTARTEILKIVELEENEGKVVNSFHDANDKDVNPTQSDKEMVNVEGQQGLLSITESKMAESLKEPVKSREICPNPYKTEVSMSVTDQECVDSPDTSPNDTHTYLGPNGEKQEDEDEEVRLILTKANLYVKPTTEEGRSPSLSRFQALSEKDTHGKVSISVKDENNEESNGITKPTGSTNQATSLQLSSSLGGLKFGGPETVGIADNKYVQNVGHGSEDQKENPSMNSEVMGQKKSEWLVANVSGNSEKVFVKSDSSGSVPANEETTICGVDTNSGGIVSRKSDLASGMAASFGGTAVSSSGTVRGDAEAAIKAEVQGRIQHGNGKSTIYGSKESLSRAALPGQPETGKFSSRGGKDWMVYGAGLRLGYNLPSEGKEEGPSEATNSAMGTRETRFGRRGSGEWMVYGGSIGSRTSSSSPSVAPAFSVPDLQRVGGREEWKVDSCNLQRASSLSGGESLTNSYSRENRTMVTSPPERRRCDSKGSGDLRVYGGGAGRMSSWAGSCSLPNADSDEIPSVAVQLETNPPGSRKLGSLGSGEWRVYAGSTGSVTSVGSVGSVGSTDRVSVVEKYNQLISPPSSHVSSGLRSGGAGSAGRLSTGSFVKRSGSVGSTGRVSGAGSGSHPGSSSGSHRSNSSGRFAMTGGNRISSPGSGSKLSRAASSEVISSRTGGRVAGSSGSGRSNVTGGRVISSSIRQIRNPGSGVGGSKERISVCKMAALSISAAAGRERSQGKQGQQQKQKQDPKTSPLLQRWLSTGVGVTCDDPDDSDDDMRP